MRIRLAAEIDRDYGGVGAIVVYCIGEGLDWLYENLFKKPVFE